MTGLAIGMAALVAAVLAAILALVRAAARRAGSCQTRATWIVGGGLAAWLAVTGTAAAAGVLRLDGGPPRAVLLPVVAVIGALLVLRGRAGRTLVGAAPRGAVIALQSFRLPVELLLWGLFLAGEIPIQMTFEGRNLDVLVGATAIPVALAAYGAGRRRHRLAIAWHAASIALLLNIVAIAVASTPGPLRIFTDEPANRIIGTFPFVWLPAFLVPAALVGHLVGLRHALAGARSMTTTSSRSSESSNAPVAEEPS